MKDINEREIAPEDNISGTDTRHTGISKEKILKELTGAYVMYFAFKNTSEKYKYFYAGQMRAIENIAVEYFDISSEEMNKIKQRIKEKFDRIESRIKEYENEGFEVGK